MKKQRFEFRTLLALVLAITIIMLPFDTLALTGHAETLENTETSENTATPDEAEPTQREKDDDLAQTGTNILDGDGTEESPYLIQSAADWDTLSESINSDSTEYSGKYFKMTDDISVSTMLGNRPDTSTDSNDNVFSGVFDGDGHELNVNLDDPVFAAPFAVAHNATIKNLHVTGTVKTGANHSTGLVAASKGKSIYDASYLIIQNVTVSTDVSCNSHIAGIVGHAHSADITMENVVFDGNLSASSIQGGMIGWGGLGNGARYSASFKDCLFAGTYNTNAAFYPVAFANGQGTATLINDFYTTSIGSGGSPIPLTGDGQLKLLAATVEKDGNVRYFDSINTAADGSNWVAGSTLKLMADVSNGATITVPSGMHILDLNGHTLLELSTVGKFMVGNGASSTADLTIIDSIGTGVIKHETSRPGSLIWIKEGSSLTLDRGTLEANSSASPVIDFFQQKNASFTMNGGKITGTANNGAVRFGTNCTFTMTGGEISGLQTSTGVFDYSAGSGGAIIISGNPVVKNNTANGTTTNFNLPSGRVLTINDEMTDGASIGITTQSGPAAFTSGWKDNMGDADPSKYFTSDNDTYDVFLNKNGEAEIGVPPVASVINGDTTTNYGSLSDAVNAWTAGSTLKLLTDVTTSSTITVPSGEHTLDLNGHGIRMTGSGSVINVGNGTTLNLDDSNTDTTHKFDVPEGAGLAVLNEANGNHTVNGGYITGGNANPYGGGVRVAIDGKFNMYGGTVIGNTATSHGGGVSVSGAGQGASSVDNFKMYGGAITYNTANWGGGIGIYGKTYLYEKSIISNNTANSGGGGIELENNGRLYMSGGTVTENAVLAQNGGMWKGGGIHMPNGSECHIQGNVLIKDNYQETYGSKQNNLFIRKEVSGKVILDGELTLTAPIGVGTNGNAPFTVTAGYGAFHAATDPSKYFTSDDSNYAVILNNNGEAEINLPPVASIISGETTTNYSSISDAVNAWTAGSTLKLLADVTTSSTITVPAGEHTLDLNGYGILMTGNDRVVTINQGASLELNDSDPDRIHYITLTNYRGTAVSDSGEASVSSGNGVIQVSGGYLTGGYRNNSGSHDRCGAGVYNWGTFVMNGGSIVGNTLYNNSGGAIRNSGYFTMNGGTIAFNYASGNGGGVTTYVPGGSQGKMTMNGGEISDNYCGSYGGGIQIAGPIEMTGGSVVRNTAGAGGSGVFYDGKNDRFKLSGNPVIKDNSNNDDLYLGANATFMINGSLTEEADIHVLMNTPAEFTVGWKNIMGNADPSKYFTSDDSNYAVILNNNGEAEIAPPPVASIISGDVTTGYSSISDAVNAWTAGSTLKLLADVTTNSTITVPSGEHTLDLNGYALKAGSAGYSVITVGSGADLTINDTAGKDGKITGGSVGQNYGGGVTVDGGTLTLKGGAVSGNANTYGGIGNCGGGVHVRNSGKFYMEGGEISGNTSYVGGGVCSDASATTVSITGGVIKSNKTDRFGSAIWAGRSSSAVFRIGGDVQIIDNISTWTADKNGEASVNFVGALLLSGNPTVHGDWKANGTSSPNTHINLDNDGSGIQRIELEGALTNDTGAPSITMSPIYRWNDLRNGQTFVFTKNWSQYMGTAHPADYFKLDDSVSGVTVIRKDGEAAFTGSGDLGDLYITYDANEGEGEMDAQLAKTSSVQLNKNTFTHKDLVFGGWNTKKDGSGTAYADGANITLSGDLTLYAQWKEPVASIISGETTTSYSSLSDAVNAWTVGSTLKLLADVTTDGTINVPTGEHNLDLNGHGITRTGATGNDNTGLVITMGDGVNLTVTGPGKITGGRGFHGGGIHVEGNSSLVLDNCEISGNTGHYGGGLYLKNGTITLKNGTVVKNNSATEGFGGSGIYAEGGGTLILEGGTFTDNEIRNSNQYAVFLAGNANAQVSGAPVIYDNKYGDTQKNLYMFQASGQQSIVRIAGALTDGAKIGVGQTTGAGKITSSWKDIMGDADPSTYFTSDNDSYVVALSGGEATVKYPDLTGVTADGYEGGYDGEAHGITVTAPDGVTIKYGTKEGSYTLTDNPTYTDAGTYTVYYEASKEKYSPVYGSAVVQIDPIDVTVTITGHNSTVDYDGTSHRVTGYDAVADTELYDVSKDFSFIGLPKAERTDVGTTIMGLEAVRFENTNSNFENVVFLVTDGYLTVDPVDAVLTTAPHAKNELVYNGSEQELIAAGSVDGGTLYYAIGKDHETSPDDDQYEAALPVGKDVGNYYIWYKVMGDSNHNDLSPAYVKITMADQGWGTVSGGIVDKNNNPVKNATVTLTAGGRVIDEIISGSDGSYYFTVPAGIYDIVVESGDATVTEMVNVADRTTYDVTVPDSDTDSLLDVVDSDDDIVVGGLSKEAALIREQESVPDDQNVTVKMTVRTISGSETEGSTAISDYAPDKNFKFYDFKVEKTVGSQTTALDATQSVLEIAIPCSFTNKSEFAVYNNSSSGVQMLTESDSKAAGTYRVDQQSGMVYIYTNSITTYAVGYKPYYSVTSDVSLGSYTGDVSVTLTKDGSGETYELNNVSLQNISFKGIPKGTYSMTVTWTDGAENTITTPFIIK